MSRGSVVGIATGYVLDDQGVGVRVSVGSRIFTPACCPYQLWGAEHPKQWVEGAPSQGEKQRERKADHHLQLVLKSIEHGTIHPLLDTHSRCCAQRQLYLIFAKDLLAKCVMIL
jgi:hypothetical protein